MSQSPVKNLKNPTIEWYPMGFAFISEMITIVFRVSHNISSFEMSIYRYLDALAGYMNNLRGKFQDNGGIF